MFHGWKKWRSGMRVQCESGSVWPVSSVKNSDDFHFSRLNIMLSWLQFDEWFTSRVFYIFYHLNWNSFEIISFQKVEHIDIEIRLKWFIPVSIKLYFNHLKLKPSWSFYRVTLPGSVNCVWLPQCCSVICKVTFWCDIFRGKLWRWKFYWKNILLLSFIFLFLIIF